MVILELLRRTLTQIRRFKSSTTEVMALDDLRALQTRLRQDPDLEHTLPLLVLLHPFLSVLNTPVLSEPFMVGALSAIFEIIGTNEHFSGRNPEELRDAMSELVDTLTSFRYVQTSFNHKEVLPFIKIKVLSRIMSLPLRNFLTNESCWTIGHAFYTITLSSISNSPMRNENLSQMAESGFNDFAKTLMSHGKLDEAEADNINKVGLPCIMKLVGFLVKKLMKAATPQSGAVWEDLDVREFLVVAGGLKSLIRGEGKFSKSQEIFLGCPSLATMIRDDIGKYVLFIATDRSAPQEVLEAALSLFGVMVEVLGLSIKITIECFFQFVYLKVLNQMETMSELQTKNMEGNEVDSKSLNLSASYDFSVGEMEIIMESLSDVLSVPEFVASLFMSFDCDPTKRDILQQLWKYLSLHCSAQATCFENGDPLKYVLGLAGRCYSLLLNRTSSRANNVDGRNMDRTESGEAAPSISQAHTQFGDSKLGKYFESLHEGKKILHEASRLFSIKPWTAFEYLLKEDVFQWPLDPSSVAAFLRISPWIPKEDVGTFLGRLGDSKAAENSHKGVKFAKDVLSNYVRNFQFAGLSLVQCMRVFLSAFRLPGEAQQIDRILIEFSETCHQNCIEGQSGIIEHHDVTYVLCFAIIMLNTDLHNPNIKPERKMKMADFVKNNTNYGKDVNQTKPLPRDFLEGIYESIRTSQIRTERNDDQGTLTVESWSDLQFEADADSRKGWMISIASDDSVLKCINETLPSDVLTGGSISDALLVPAKILSSLLSSDDAAEVLWHPIALSKQIERSPSGIGKQIFECTWRYTFAVAVAPLRSWARHFDTEYFADGTSYGSNMGEGTEDSSTIRQTFDFMVELVKLSKAHEKAHLTDVIMFVLADFAGALRSSNIEAVYDALIYDTNTFDLHDEQDDDGLDMGEDVAARFIDRITVSAAARAALCTFLQIVKTDPTLLGESWAVVTRTLGLLRDTCLLPAQLVATLADDLLPGAARRDFEREIKPSLLSSPKSPRRSPVKRTASGSFFEVIFGAGGQNEEPSRKRSDSHLNRWDEGYEGETGGEASISTQLDAAGGNLREMIKMCGVEALITDTKFMDEGSLLRLLRQVVTTAEKDPATIAPRGQTPANLNVESVKRVLEDYSATLPGLSASTISWLEVLMIDIALRNRDRFSLVWPVLSGHYKRTLCPTKGTQLEVNYIVERRVTGLLKLVARMLSRRHLTAAMIAIMKDIFVSGQTGFDKLQYFRPYAAQISAGLWSIMTNNIAVLPLLQLEEWQTLFDVLEIGSAAGDYASAKAFEAMAFLLHEPRLRSEVPIFCLVAIKPLLNCDVSESVAVGAVRLLVHLHSRLEILIDADSKVDDDSSKDDGDDEPSLGMLWESCWYPVLSALSDGIHGSRLTVVIACIDGLSTALTDKHAEYVPVQVMTRILVQLILPAASETARSFARFRNDFVAIDLDNGSETPVERPSDEMAQLEASVNRFISSMSETFIGFMPRLAAHPDILRDLWLNIICALGGYLGGPRVFGKSKEVENVTREIGSKTIDAATFELNGLLVVAKQAKIFESLPSGGELLENTQKAISGFTLFAKESTTI